MEEGCCSFGRFVVVVVVVVVDCQEIGYFVLF